MVNKYIEFILDIQYGEQVYRVYTIQVYVHKILHTAYKYG